MKRFFQKKPPPGWTPPNPAAAPPVRVATPRQAALVAEAVRHRSTDSRTATAFGNTDTIPWTSASLKHDDGTVELRDANGNVQHLQADPRLVDRRPR